MQSPEGKGRNPSVTIRFLAPFGGRDNWNLEVPITSGESLTALFGRLEERLQREIKEKILEPLDPPCGVVLKGERIAKERFSQIHLEWGEQVTDLALLVGG